MTISLSRVLSENPELDPERASKAEEDRPYEIGDFYPKEVFDDLTYVLPGLKRQWSDMITTANEPFGDSTEFKVHRGCPHCLQHAARGDSPLPAPRCVPRSWARAGWTSIFGRCSWVT